MNKIFTVILLLFSFFFQIKIIAQNSIFREFKQISYQEKLWVARHPFIAGKAWKITQFTKAVSDTIKSDSILDGNDNGGQVDAFRHAFWMASLTQKNKIRYGLMKLAEIMILNSWFLMGNRSTHLLGKMLLLSVPGFLYSKVKKTE